jgi:lipopolysaccharide export system protein LptA
MLDQTKKQMNLQRSARVWDPTGSASADTITMDQESSDFKAEGHVSSTRLPDKKGSSSAMLSKEEPLQAKADRMTSSNGQQKILYEGHAVAWQGANRVEAERLHIDREKSIFEARGNVVSQFVDKPKPPDPKKDGKAKAKAKAAGPPVYTVIHAPEMTYTEEGRLAHYKGGVVLTRPGMKVTAKEIRAYLKDASDDSSLDHVFADGAVEIVSTSPKRTRTATGEHAEYYASEEKVVINGGQPKLVDSLRGQTRGRELTWWANDDRLLVEGAPGQPAESTLRKK